MTRALTVFIWCVAAFLRLDLPQALGAERSERYLDLAATVRSSCGWGAARSNASVTGTPLRVGSMAFERGIGTHAPAELVFALGGDYKWLTFWAGVSADMVADGSITIEVWLDGVRAYDTDVISVGDDAHYVSLPIGDAEELRIVATDAGNGMSADHVVLGNLRVTTDAEEPESGVPAPPKFGAEAEAPPEPMSLWYRRRAPDWFGALPLGSGRLGAMVFGGISTERLMIDESTFWSGEPNDESFNPEGRAHMGEIRRMFFDGRYSEGVSNTREYLLGRKGNYGTHLPLANLRLDFDMPDGEVLRYRRELDLPEAIARQRMEIGKTLFTREAFSSNVDGVIAIRLESQGDETLGLTVTLDGGANPSDQTIEGGDTLVMAARARETIHSDGETGVAAECRARVLAEGGTVKPVAGAIEVRDARAVTLLVSAHTDFDGPYPRGRCRREIRLASAKGYESLRRDHVADHRELFDRVSLDVGGEGACELPTDERLEAVRNGQPDPHLASLLFQYGRYLLIASSREDSPLPANLQGIWNDNRACRIGWTCDFHLDINTQQNYWPADVTGLGECAAPLFDLVERLRVHGEQVARGLYGCDGWVAHVVTNAWGYAAPGWSTGWGMHTTGGAWIASHLWDHYEFTGDREFLEARAYPVLRGAAEFYLDYMVEHPIHGWLVTGPACSPENSFVAPGGSAVAESMGPTCDTVVVRDLFEHCMEASLALGVDHGLRERLRVALWRLAPLRVGRHGQLMEWLEDYEEAVPNHRHTSHLIALYPSDQISPRRTPELARAARVTIDRRLGQPDWEDVEWSRGNMICFFARLGDGDAARSSIDTFLAELVGPNLMGFSPGGIAGATQGIWVMDGNTAATAGIAEMLLQSRHDELTFLPTLPEGWPSGSVLGLRARGGLTVDLAWRDGHLTEATVRSTAEGEWQPRLGEAYQARGPDGPVRLARTGAGQWSFRRLEELDARIRGGHE